MKNIFNVGDRVMVLPPDKIIFPDEPSFESCYKKNNIYGISLNMYKSFFDKEFIIQHICNDGICLNEDAYGFTFPKYCIERIGDIV